MWFWISLAILGIFLLLGLAYWMQRSTRRYEQQRLRDVLSEEMQLTLRNERTENKLKKEQFEALLKEAGEARLSGRSDKNPPSN